MTDVLVLCFHAVSDRWPASLAVTPAQLSGLVTTLLQRGFVPTTFTQAVTDPPSVRTLAVTFDDGFRSVLEHGLPVLEPLGVPATVFVPTAFPGSGGPLRWDGIDEWEDGPFGDELASLDWDELNDLACAGWEIGSHTVSHPHLTTLPDVDLYAELVRSRDECEAQLRRRCTALAYPYGDVDARVARAAGNAGYRCAAALPHARGMKVTGLTVPRVGVYRRDGPRRFAAKVSRPGRGLQALR